MTLVRIAVLIVAVGLVVPIGVTAWSASSASTRASSGRATRPEVRRCSPTAATSGGR